MLAGMTELTPNPDGCTKFEPNPFKKEKCKNCGRIWNEHEGVISQEHVNSYLKAKKNAADAQAKKEADAKAKVKAKAAAKKKQTQAVEDSWLFDGVKEDPSPCAAADDSDDDLGFRMFSAADLSSAPIEKRPDTGFKPLKVVNLIDFGECDVAEEPMSPTPAASSANLQESSPLPPANSSPGLAGTSAAASSGGGGFVAAPASPGNEELIREIEDLRQMLRDANEEKSIQVAIVQDEVAEKQQLIEDLMRQRAEAEAALREATAKLAATEAQAQKDCDEANAAATKEREEAQQQRSKADELAAEVQKLQQAERMSSEASGLEAPNCEEFVAPRERADTSPPAQEAADILGELRGVLDNLPDMAGEEGSAAEEALKQAEEDASAKGEATMKAQLQVLVTFGRAAHAAAGRAKKRLDQLQLDLAEAREKRQDQVADATDLQIAAAGTGATDVVPARVAEIAFDAQNPMMLHTAQVIKEIRLNVERQAAWIQKRMRVSSQVDLGGPDGTPHMDAVGGGC